MREGAADSAAADGSGTPQTRTSEPTRVEGEDFSGTNVQEGGVDEADTVKTSGDFINKVGEIDKATRITPNAGSSVARFSATIAHAPTLGPPIASACHFVYSNATGTIMSDMLTYSAAMESTVNQYWPGGQDEWEPDMLMLTVMTNPRIIHTQWMTSM